MFYALLFLTIQSIIDIEYLKKRRLNMGGKTIDRFIDVKKCIKTGEYNFEQEANQFLSVLDSASKENDIQNYIKRNEKCMVAWNVWA